MDLGNDLRTLFNEKPVLSIIHPDKLENPLPVEEVTEQSKKTPDARPVLSLIHPDKLKRMIPETQTTVMIQTGTQLTHLNVMKIMRTSRTLSILGLAMAWPIGLKN